MDLLAEIDRWGRETPERLAHRGGGRDLPYGELLARSDTLAAHLAATLPDDGTPVAVLGHKEPEMLVAFLACAKAGHPFVPLDTAVPLQRIERIVTVAGASLTLTPERIVELTATAAPAPDRPPRSEDPFYIMFTSGSTGDPKGVVITRGNLTAFVEWMLHEHRLAPGAEVILDQTIFSFDLSVMGLFPGLAAGGTLVAITRDDVAIPKRMYQALAASDLTTWVSTPSFAHLVLRERSFAAAMLPRLRRFLFCGETLPPETARQLRERFPEAEVWNTYGPTETTVATTSVLVDDACLARYSPLPVGRPMPGTRVVVLDPDLRPQPDGERGEIVIAGPNVSPGYLHRPDLTQRAFFRFEDQPAYRTGDWGRVVDGLLFFEGRRDNQVKLHGYRIELGDIEAHLCDLPGVQNAVVLPLERNGRIESLAAFVLLPSRPDEPEFATASRLRTALGERLPVYMIPSRWRFPESFPTTANGKVDRRVLAEDLAPR